MMSRTVATVLLLIACTAATAAAQRMPFRGCNGTATYLITFRNFMRAGRFGTSVPALVFSPLTGVSHSNRASVLTVRGYASAGVAAIATTGNNAAFLAAVSGIQNATDLVLSVDAVDGPTMPDRGRRVRLEVDCMRPFVTVLAMIAPSPDWLVQINNMNLFDPMMKMFVNRVTGNLIAYDAGVDDGSDFTDPGDATLDVPTSPVLNIAPLSEDGTDPFGGRIVGRYIIRRMS